MQADAATKRNIQVGLKRLQPPFERKTHSAPLFVEGETNWSGAEIKAALNVAGLPARAPLSVLAVELLPEPNGSYDDPIGGDLGNVRIIRTSPLSAVERDCCAS